MISSIPRPVHESFFPTHSESVDSRPGPARHIPAIDGLRGIAVLMVVIFHIFQVEPVPSQSLFRGLYLLTRLGQTGVDLFFVLSGFLITGILVDAKGLPRYFINFYGRRTVRIFPLYYGLLIVMLLILPALTGIRLKSVNPIWLWTYTANLPMAFGADGGAFGYFWTLAIEEQFYLIWPAVVFFTSRATLLRICIGCIAGAIFARAVAEFTGVSSFSFTLCRIDSLTVGGLLALVMRIPRTALSDGKSRRKIALAVILGTIVLMVPLYVFKTGSGDHWVQIFKYTPTAALYGALLILAIESSSTSWVGRVLTCGPLSKVGRYSYGIYMYQAFVIQLAAAWLSTAQLGSIGISTTAALWVRVASILLLTYALAWLSWHFYEKPFLRLKSSFEPRPGQVGLSDIHWIFRPKDASQKIPGSF